MDGELIYKLAAETGIQSTGEISITFATLGVVDRDGDVIAASAIPVGRTVPIMGWNHQIWDPPIGEATLAIDGNKAVAVGRLFIDTQRGMEYYNILKNRTNQEWSWGFIVNKFENSIVDGAAVRVITDADVLEVSPVLRGAGIGTATNWVKSGSQFREQIAAVQAAVGDVVYRAGSLAELRAKEGRVLSAANRELLSSLLSALREASSRLSKLLDETASEKDAEKNAEKDAKSALADAAIEAAFRYTFAKLERVS